jgi:N-acetylmuramoyl-L-alanine amidase
VKQLRLFLIVIWILLTGCTGVNYHIDDSTYRATGKNQRIKFIIIHYTACDDEISIKTLTEENVSSHYLVTTSKRDPVFQLVSDNERAWHAGKSYFQGRSNLNDTSIGIEIVNPGYLEKGDKLEFYPFEESQIKKISNLIKKLSQKYKISPDKILGHSDIAPQRKIDPGPLFPWERMYREYGIGAWYDDFDYYMYQSYYLFGNYSVEDIQREFRKYGYNMDITGEWGEKERNVLKAFQMHFRPQKINGEMDLETFAIIKALNYKYR